MSPQRALSAIVLILVAGFIALYAQTYYLPEEHQQAAVALERLGGKVTVKRRFVLGLPVQRFTVVNLSASRVVDAELVHLKGLSNLSALTLDDTGITDAGLVHLKGMAQLESLDLRKTRVTIAAVSELQAALPGARIER
jgi:hypothetical protein